MIRWRDIDLAIASYDAEGDLLAMHVGEPAAGEGEETPEGHFVHFAPGTDRVVGLTVLNAGMILREQGRIEVDGDPLVGALPLPTSGPPRR